MTAPKNLFVPLSVPLLAALALLSGCKGNSPDKVMDRAHGHFRMQSPVVLVAAAEPTRTQMENEIVAALKAQRMQAVASHTFAQDLAGLDVRGFKGWVESHNQDCVLTIEPFAASEVSETRTEAVEVIEGSDFTAVAEQGWTSSEVAGDYGVRLAVWKTAGWKNVWAGELDQTFDVTAGPGGLAESVTAHIESENL